MRKRFESAARAGAARTGAALLSVAPPVHATATRPPPQPRLEAWGAAAAAFSSPRGGIAEERRRRRPAAAMTPASRRWAAGRRAPPPRRPPPPRPLLVTARASLDGCRSSDRMRCADATTYVADVLALLYEAINLQAEVLRVETKVPSERVRRAEQCALNYDTSGAVETMGCRWRSTRRRGRDPLAHQGAEVARECEEAHAVAERISSAAVGVQRQEPRREGRRRGRQRAASEEDGAVFSARFALADGNTTRAADLAPWLHQRASLSCARAFGGARSARALLEVRAARSRTGRSRPRLSLVQSSAPVRVERIGARLRAAVEHPRRRGAGSPRS